MGLLGFFVLKNFCDPGGSVAREAVESRTSKVWFIVVAAESRDQ